MAKEKMIAIATSVPYEALQGTIYEGVSEIQSTYDLERRIFMLSPKTVEILILKYFGFTGKEITEILHFKDHHYYYRLNDKLKRDYLQILKNEGL